MSEAIGNHVASASSAGSFDAAHGGSLHPFGLEQGDDALAGRIVANAAPVMDDAAQACGGDACVGGHPATRLSIRVRHYLGRRRRDCSNSVNRVDGRMADAD
jgi:hypothetical protein